MRKCEILQFPKCSYALQEGFNTLATNLTFTGKSVRKVMFTSSYAAEGKSLIAMNMLRTLANLGYKVVLVDADMRRSMLRGRHGIRFQEGEGQGLSHYLASMNKVSEVVYETNIPNASMVPVGREVENSLQLLNSPRFGELLNALTKHFDYVLVDAPPVGAIIDAAQIAKSCDGSLLVVQYNMVPKRTLMEIYDQMSSTGCPVLGVVINGVEADGPASKYYYYRKNYYYRYDQRYDTNKSRQNRNSKQSPQQAPQPGPQPGSQPES